MINNIGDNNKEIRVRIVPNSNEVDDLQEKQIVKDITICYLKEAYDEDYNIYINNIEKGKLKLKEVIVENIKEDVLINFGNHTLYNKTYNNMVVENSTELTLLITIGRGLGDNWWGTVYPEFLSVNSSDVLKYESVFVELFNKIRGETQND
jgi:hypothetical protein